MDHGTVNAAELHNSCSFGPHVSLPWSIAERTQATYNLQRILGEICLEVRRQEFPELSPGHKASGSNNTVTSPTGAQHITKVTESGSIKHGDVDINFSLAIDGPRLTLPPRADIVWVFDQLLSYATACLVDPQHALWAQDGVSANTTTADSTGELARHPDHHQRPGLHVDMEPFIFHALSLEIHCYWVSAMSTRSLAVKCFCSWRTMKMASVVPLPGTKLNWISWMLKSSSFMFWSVTLRPW